MLTIELTEPIRSGECECCGGVTTSLTRFVHDDGNAHAIYYAQFSDNHSDRIVKAAISLGEWGEGSSPADRRSFALRMRSGVENYEVMVVDASDSAWSNVDLLGRMLDRKEAIEDPRIGEVFHITDHILLEDRLVRNYLDGA